ncbi:MAG TPA: histidine phosphatase family protein, partial [Streptosporangiaceae bacterium]
MSDETIVHLLRHGEVENPAGIIYGRLPGYHLSANGRVMASAAAGFFAGRPVAVLYCSPLERAQETARPVAERLGLDIVTDDRLVESWNHFEGMKFGVGDGSLRRPAHWPYLINPFRPSWGEPYRTVTTRMFAMMETARAAAAGQEAVCVSHQLPIWVTRRMAENKRLWHNPTSRECALGSVTSFTYSGDRLTGVHYTVPARGQV